MGVLGFTPFLQKVCPQVIKYIPTRLRALSGKRIAIDGNLVTQRFHFGPLQHEYRHVIGWYKIIRDLRANGVEVITVWDGKERSSAKAREEARRRAIRLLQQARGTHELGRLHRLQRLTEAVKKYQQLDLPSRLQVSRAVRVAAGPSAEAQLLDLAEVMDKVQGSKAVEAANEDDAKEEEELDQADRAMRKAVLLQLYPAEERESLASFLDDCAFSSDIVVGQTVDDAYEAALDVLENATTQDPWDFYDDLSDVSSEDAAPYTFGRSHYYDAILSAPLYPPLPADLASIANVLIELYRDFKKSTGKRGTKPVLEVAQDGKVPELESVAPSKYQVQLSQEEQLFWKRLTNEVAHTDAEPLETKREEEEEVVEALLNRSGKIASSYEKRNRLPTQATYAESRRIVAAMGVPCIEAEYPYEAEAVAASLVIHGHADFVGSEDTDVLVYEAPLLRNLTSYKTPLALVSGTAVREALQLSRTSFVDFALLLGTDFTRRVKNLGPFNAIKLIREYGSIEKLLESQSKYAPESPEAYLQQIEVARLVFSTLPPVPEPALMQAPPYSGTAVRAILKECHITPADLEEDRPEQELRGIPQAPRSYFGDKPTDPGGSYRGWESAVF